MVSLGKLIWVPGKLTQVTVTGGGGVGAVLFLLPGGLFVLPRAHMGQGLAPELGSDGGVPGSLGG